MPSIGIAGSGIHVWFKLPNVMVFWLELGPQKTKVFIQGGAALAAMALLIPPPYGPIVAALAASQIAAVKAAAGPKGVWVKFGPTGYIKAKTRTAANKETMPTPF